jgi:DNA ligase 1
MKATKENLKVLRQYIDETNSSNSNLDKLAVLEKYKDNEFIKKVLHYTFNDLLQFRITSANLKKNDDIIAPINYYGDDLFLLLDNLHHCKISGHGAIGLVNRFILEHSEFKDILLKIIDRNLETRVTSTLINRVIPGLIPEFDVALCESYDKLEDKKKPNFQTEIWYSSRKLDGCRAPVVIDANGDGTFYSRTGKEFKTLSNVLRELKRLGFKDVVLDGEICIVDENGQDDFTAIMKEITKKDHTVGNPNYRIFDVLTHEEFFSKTSKATFSERISRLGDIVFAGNQMIQVLPQERLKNQAHLDRLRAEAAEKGWEGLIIRKDVAYKGKRSKDILKVKNFLDAEYVVEDVINGPFRYIAEIDIDQSGIITKKEITEEMLSAVVIKHKGHPVDVGSGFSIEQRKTFFKDPSKIIGKTITVKYFTESTNQQGGISLRFPVVKAIYENGRTV